MISCLCESFEVTGIIFFATAAWTSSCRIHERAMRLDFKCSYRSLYYLVLFIWYLVRKSRVCASGMFELVRRVFFVTTVFTMERNTKKKKKDDGYKCLFDWTGQIQQAMVMTYVYLFYCMVSVLLWNCAPLHFIWANKSIRSYYICTQVLHSISAATFQSSSLIMKMVWMVTSCLKVSHGIISWTNTELIVSAAEWLSLAAHFSARHQRSTITMDGQLSKTYIIIIERR